MTSGNVGHLGSSPPGHRCTADENASLTTV
jgi:hypothetical protein